mgnify:FL=1
MTSFPSLGLIVPVQVAGLPGNVVLGKGGHQLAISQTTEMDTAIVLGQSLGLDQSLIIA